ncbi:DUF4157 domain-containing protein [Okeania sp. SIO3I5]|uniref:eCIS core domain-containing protein n=1 Tax=Okeania sp. SIO3I5 TaxID=2607805 RepID=UPI0025D5EB99|nr:DUF4157 domain-containing protein [Okeania sp. SIO3I5]
MIKTSLKRATSSYQPSSTQDQGKTSFQKTEIPVQPKREYLSPETLEKQGYKQPKPGAIIENVMAAQLAGIGDQPSEKVGELGNILRAPRPSDNLGSVPIQPKFTARRPPLGKVEELGNILRAPRPSHNLGGVAMQPKLTARRPPSYRGGAIAKEQVSESIGNRNEETSLAPIQAKETETANKTGLPDRLKSGIENLSGYSMDDVKVHYNSDKPAQLQAHAYAQGTDIHVAPGQEKHLPHEAWHVVQQKQGRVKPTMQLKVGVNVNDDAGLEKEADVMGKKAFQVEKSEAMLSLQPSHKINSALAKGLQRKSAHPSEHYGGLGVIQKKSHFINPFPSAAPPTDIPLQTLHNTFSTFFKQSGQHEQYNFQSVLKNIQPNDPTYSGQPWAKARKVAAIIEDTSRKKVGGARDNSVIIPYGHFGMMERAIHQRPDKGNIYDGGHLIAHALMEGADADVHGNLAPQEGKSFNQSLMRAWEKYPEEQPGTDDFQYEVEVKYDGTNYTKTGAELVTAGVIPGAVPSNLSPTDQATFNAKTATFERWVPISWHPKVSALPAKNILPLTTAKGAHFNNVTGTTAAAESSVSAPPSSLARTKSNTVAGAFDPFGDPGTGMVTFGGGGVNTVSANMFQSQPEPMSVQPGAPGPGGVVMAPFTAPPPPSKQLPPGQTYSLGTMKKQVQTNVTFKTKDRKRKLNDTTVDSNAKKKVPLYHDLRKNQFLDLKNGVKLLREVGESPQLLEADFVRIISTLDKSVQGKMHNVVNSRQDLLP